MTDSATRPAVPPRDHGLDLARAWAVTVMVLGHVLDATLLVQARQNPAIATYWQLRGLTAPLFLLVSGWAVSMLFCRRPRLGLWHARERMPRIATLFGLGLLLRFPTWALDRLMDGDPKILAHFLAMDVLQLIGLCLLLGGLLFGLSTRPAIRMALAGTAALVVLLATSAVWSLADRDSWWSGLVLGGGKSPFPLFPWATYFLSGMGLGSMSTMIPSPRRRALYLMGGGLVLAAAAALVDGHWYVQARTTDPALTVYRLGLVTAWVGVLGLAPASWGRRLAPLGRRTLAIYFIHLIMVYGALRIQGMTYRVGHTLSPIRSLALGILTLVIAAALAFLWSRRRHAWQFLRDNRRIHAILRRT